MVLPLKPHIVDKSKIAKPNEMEDFKRPDHPDFATASELKERNFCGTRSNSLTNSFEIWLDGDIAATVTQAQVALNPNAVSEAYEKVFALEDACQVFPDKPELRAYHKKIGKDKS